jgi:hypothetical protein
VRRGVTRPGLVGCILVSALASACAIAFPATTEARASCAQAVIQDWVDGRIDSSYAVACYRSALRQLPEDVRTYSSAPEDISRALAARVARPVKAVRSVAVTRAEAAERGDGVPTQALVAGSLALVVLSLGSAGLVLRRRLRR